MALALIPILAVAGLVMTATGMAIAIYGLLRVVLFRGAARLDSSFWKVPALLTGLGAMLLYVASSISAAV